MLDRDRGLRRHQLEHPAGSLGHLLQRPLPDDDQHAADVAVAQHRLEHGATSRSRFDQRSRQSGMVARVGDEVRLLRGERLAATRAVAARLDRHGLDVRAGHRRGREVAPRRLQQERDRRVHDLRGRLADRLAGIVTRRECLGHTADRTHSSGLISKHVVEPAQISCVGLSFKFARQHPRQHHEQLLIGSGKGIASPRHRGQRADARPVGQLQRHAQIRPGAGAALHRERLVGVDAADIAGQARSAPLGHVRAEGVAQGQRLIRAQPVVCAPAYIHDAVDELAPIEVRHEHRGVGHVALEQVEHGARRVGERSVRRRGRRRCSLDRAHVHVRHHRHSIVDSEAGHPSNETRHVHSSRRHLGSHR